MIYKWNSEFTKNEMMQQEALTSLALYDPYHTNTAHKQ